MNNAIKFTEKGFITVQISILALKNKKVQIKFEVNDSGVGISPEICQKLFQKFLQADSSTTRKYGGTGLGLSICKHLVEMMGGEIGVDSKLGEGSTFWFQVPLEIGDIQKVDSKAQHRITKGNFKRGRVLIVDDNKTNQFVAIEYLKKLGHDVQAVDHGKEALDLFNNETFDIILMDCQMPVMDGYEATQKIRERENQNKLNRTPIWALTADAMSGDYKKAIAAGMDGYLTKPINFKKLAETINSCLSKKTSINWSVLDGLNKYSTPGTDISIELIKIFLETSPEAVSKIESAVKYGDYEILNAQAHYLKSSCGNIGADAMRLICEKLEDLALSNSDESATAVSSQTLQLFDAFKKEYELVIAELEVRRVPQIKPSKVS
jgi:CheY-like chemotaxis protein/HPt (histidine-containing phosphotransfer) domain-containing protein